MTTNTNFKSPEQIEIGDILLSLQDGCAKPMKPKWIIVASRGAYDEVYISKDQVEPIIEAIKKLGEQLT